MTEQQPLFRYTPHPQKRSRQQHKDKVRDFAKQVCTLIAFYEQRRPKAEHPGADSR